MGMPHTRVIEELQAISDDLAQTPGAQEGDADE